MSSTNILTQMASMPKEDRFQRELDRMGVEGHYETRAIKDKDGNDRIVRAFIADKIPAWNKIAVSILTGSTPCTFKGCQEVVDNYNKQRNELSGCTGCKLAPITRAAIYKLRELMPPEMVNKVDTDKPKYRVVNKVIQGERMHLSEDGTFKPIKDEPVQNTGVVSVPRPGGSSQEGTGERQSLLRKIAKSVKQVFTARKSTPTP